MEILMNSMMSLKKQFLKSKPICKVTFRLSKEDVAGASSVKLMGSFTGWEINAVDMTRLKSGEFTATVSLPSNESFEYRYLLDDSSWINDPAADGYNPNRMGTENSVVTTYA